MDIANRLQSLMESYGYSQYRLAVESGLSQPFLSLVLKGKKNLSLEAITHICKVFSITLGDFFREDITDPFYELPPYVRSFAHFCEDLNYDEVKALRSMAELFPSKLKKYTKFNNFVYAPVPGIAAAGVPIYSEIDDEIIAPAKYQDTERYLIIRAHGDSMTPKINSGDHVVVERNSTPANGELALVQIDGGPAGTEYVIKLFYDTNEGFILRSINSSYEPLIYKENQVISAQRIVYVISK